MDFMTASQFGMMNSLRTGNPLVDICACMLIPFVFRLLGEKFNQVRPWLQKTLHALRMRGAGEYYREIEYKWKTTGWGFSHDREQHNNLLQKALRLYLSDQKGLDFVSASLALTSTSASKDSNGSTAEQLKTYDVTTVPPEEVWIEVAPKIKFRQTVSVEREGEKSNQTQTTTVCYTLYSHGAGGEKRVDDFIQTAYEWYMDKLEAEKSTDRHMYVLVATTKASGGGDGGGDGDGDGGGDDETRVYKRYLLSDAKDFRSLYFPEKDEVTRLLEHFMEKRGKFAKAGFPHKLGLLLHGPPGTGKTSLIKAIATHTKRNIVSVPLGKIKTNQELMDIVFDQRFSVAGEDSTVNLDFSKLVFVMEDVDAASNIVHARKTATKKTTITLTKEESTADNGEEALAQASALLEGEDSKKLMGNMLKNLSKSRVSSNDKLDLSGVLNVLDGVVDCPARILIMTTNHPEKLDPALIRPGRINQKLHLTYMTVDCARQLIEHYFGALGEAHTATLRTIFEEAERDWTPAEVEQMCAEHETIEDMLEGLRQFTDDAFVAWR